MKTKSFDIYSEEIKRDEVVDIPLKGTFVWLSQARAFFFPVLTEVWKNSLEKLSHKSVCVSTFKMWDFVHFLV